MTRTIDAGPGARAGLGLFRIHLSCGSDWGHGGDESACSNQVLAARDGSRIVVVAQNTSAGRAPKPRAEQMYCR